MPVLCAVYFSGHFHSWSLGTLWGVSGVCWKESVSVGASGISMGPL